jgi:hypothetical protein
MSAVIRAKKTNMIMDTMKDIIKDIGGNAAIRAINTNIIVKKGSNGDKLFLRSLMNIIDSEKYFLL